MGTATSAMKLTSAVIIASTTAQQGARQRENKNPDFGFGGDYGFGDNYDIFSAFNDFNFGLGDAFGDASDTDAAADYMNTVASDYDGADDLGSIRPSEDDEVKSNFVVDTGDGTAEFNNDGTISAGTNEVQDMSSFDFELSNGDHSGAQRCFVGSAGNSNVVAGTKIKSGSVVSDWFSNGVWDVCEGESDTCEIKAVRRNEVIQQIHSKCANRHSCVDNMRQNFNPQSADPAGNNFIFSSWTHQACRPRWSANYGATRPWNGRQQQRDSVCFFCVEPCRNTNVWTNEDADKVRTAHAMRESECVGRSSGTATDSNGAEQPVVNAAPIPGSNMRLFDDCSSSDATDPTLDPPSTEIAAADAYNACERAIESDFGQTVWSTSGPKNEGTGPDMKLLNFYSVIDSVMLHNTEKDSRHPLSMMQDVSQIQYAQINARDTLDIMTDAVDPNNPVRFSFSDNSANAQSDRDNLAKLFDNDSTTEYTTGASVVTDGNAAEFEVVIDFVDAVTFTSMTLEKGGSTPFAGTYKGMCVKTYDAAGTEVASDCAEEADGQTGAANTEDTITFALAGGSVKSAKITFDTTAATGNTAQATVLKGLSMNFTV